MKKTLSLALVFSLMLTICATLCLPASAALETDYTGYYKIGNAGQLSWFACLVVGDTSQSGITEAVPNAKAVLTADIDITVLAERFGKTWSGIGTVETPFTGIFDGNGYSIKGLTIDTTLTKPTVATIPTTTTEQGLFGVIGEGGVVRNLTLAGSASVSEGQKVGAVCAQNNGLIENVLSTMTVEGGVSPMAFCHTNNGAIRNCYTTIETGNDPSATLTTAEELASGKIAYHLGSAFGQTLTGDTPDLAPVHYNGENRVYFTGNGYSNTDETDYTGYYKIGNAGQLSWFACLVVGDTSQSGITEAVPNAKAVLTADIDITILAERFGKTWSGIGTAETPFTGIFDGNGYSIKGLTIDTTLTKPTVATIPTTTTEQGLFGVIGEGGVVRNLTLAGSASVSESQKVGAVCAQNNGLIENVLSTMTVEGGISPMAFCHTNNGVIRNCYTTIETGNDPSATLTTAEELASGKIAYHLGSAFGQTLTGDTPDLAPVCNNGENTVYYVESCTEGTYFYSNDGTEGTHLYNEEGSCTLCGASSILKGDLNGDKVLTIADVTVMLDALAGKTENPALSLSDMNNDETLSIADVTTLLDVLAGKATI